MLFKFMYSVRVASASHLTVTWSIGRHQTNGDLSNTDNDPIPFWTEDNRRPRTIFRQTPEGSLVISYRTASTRDDRSPSNPHSVNDDVDRKGERL